jgi:hypothetical protein
MKTSENLNELATALSKAQGIIQNPNKDADNPFFKSKYADLADVLNVVRPAFAECGLSVVQFPCNVDGNIGLTTRLMHSSGQWLESSIDLPLQGKNIAQDAGSTITYLRRYALAAVAGVFQEDNDGNQGKDKQSNTAEVQNIQAKIKPSQIKKIEELIAKTDTDKAVFCKWLSVPDVSDLFASQFDTAMVALNKKWKAMNTAKNETAESQE